MLQNIKRTIRIFLPKKLVDGIERILNRQRFRRAWKKGVTQRPLDYWTHWMVLDDIKWTSREHSLESLEDRNSQYPGYKELMPVSGHLGLSVLDYGCGPGHDLVGFAEYSAAKRIVGVDISSRAIASASERMRFHEREVEILLVPEEQSLGSFEDKSFDYVHSSGVLHHVSNLEDTLRDLRRVLKPDGRLRLMVYNQDSIWFHLYAGFVLPHIMKAVPNGVATKEIFRMSTDGPRCPIAFASTEKTFEPFARNAGFDCRRVGAAISLHEFKITSEFLVTALKSPQLKLVHREFLEEINLEGGVPMHNGHVAGIDLVLELTPIN